MKNQLKIEINKTTKTKKTNSHKNKMTNKVRNRELKEMQNEQYLESHYNTIGMRVLVLTKNGSWEGEVKSVYDNEYFIVFDGREDRKVSMHHIRSLDVAE